MCTFSPRPVAAAVLTAMASGAMPSGMAASGARK